MSIINLSINDIPLDILGEIFDYLGPSDLNPLISKFKRFHLIVQKKVFPELIKVWGFDQFQGPTLKECLKHRYDNIKKLIEKSSNQEISKTSSYTQMHFFYLKAIEEGAVLKIVKLFSDFKGETYEKAGEFLDSEAKKGRLDTIFAISNTLTLWGKEPKLKMVPEIIKKFEKLEKLELTSEEIESVPNDLKVFQNLQRLMLNHNRITSLPGDFTALSKLKQLNLSDNLLQGKIPQLNALPHLEELGLRNVGLTDFPDIFGNQNIYWLDLGGNSIREIPSKIEQLSTLNTLDLEWNQIKEIPEQISKLTSLIFLDINDNLVEKWPSGIQSLSNLQELRVGGNAFEIDISKVSHLTSMKHLDLHKGKISKIDHSIGKLTKLEDLDLDDNQIRELPDEFKNLTKLVELNLSNNQLDTVPNLLTSLTQIEELNLGGNKLKSIGEVVQIKNLKTLTINNNCIEKLPDFSGLTLQELNAENNQIIEYPGNAPSLEHVNLSNNKIATLPEKESYEALRTFNLESNLLTDFPAKEFIGNKNLNIINLKDNRITTIPNGIVTITSLRMLNINGPYLKEISDIALACIKLRKIEVDFKIPDPVFIKLNTE